MGTNFYLHENICTYCGRSEGKPLHIGKSSAGWCFSLHVGAMYSDVHEDLEINGLEDWQELWDSPVTQIRDEYGKDIWPDEMMDVITNRGWKERDLAKVPLGYSSWDDFDRMNHSEQGPNGLLRHVIDGRHCIGHGDGTYDLITGEFS